MASIRQLYVALSLRAENFNNQIRAAQAEAKEFQKTVRPTAQLLNDMGSALTSAGKAATVGLTLPIAGFAAVAVKNFSESAQASALLENAIRSTGGVAGKTADELKKMASSLQLKTLHDDDEIIRKVLTNLLTFTNVGKGVFDDATKAALNMSAVLGQDLQTSAIQVGKALNDPINGVTALQRVGVKLSESQKELVKDLVKSGDVMGAQKIILRELQTEFGGAAEAAAAAGTGPITQLGNRLGDISEKFGEIIVKGINPFIDRISKLLDWVDSWSDSTKTLVVVLGGLLAAIGPILVIMGTLASSVSNMIILYGKLAPVITASATATTLYGAAMAALPWVAVIAGATALIKVLYDLHATWKNNKEAAEETAKAQVQQANNLNKTIANLKAQGIEIDKNGKSFEQLDAEVRAIVLTLAKLNAGVKTTTDNQKQQVVVTEAQREAMKKFRDQVDGLKTSVTGSGSTIKTLTTAIKELEKAHVPAEAIAKRLASQLKEERDRAVDMNRTLDPLIGKYYEFGRSIKTVQERGLIELVEPMKLREQEHAFRTAIGNIRVELDLLKGDQVQAANEMHRNAIESSTAIKDITVGIIKEAGAQVDALGKLAGHEMTQEQKRRADQTRQIWTEATANVTSSLAKGLADVIFSGANFGKTMINIAKQTARSMFEAFLTGLLSPLTSALGQLGATLGSKLFGQGGVGGLINIGGGAAAGTAAATAGGGGIGGALGLGGGAGLFGLGAATIPVLGGAALGIWQLTKLFGRGRRTADEFVNQLQNPFGEILGQVKTREELESAWAEFNNAANQFASQGDTEAKVVRQAHNTLDPIIEDARRKLPSGATVINNFEITQQPGEDAGQLVNEILRYLQGNSYDADRFRQTLSAA